MLTIIQIIRDSKITNKLQKMAFAKEWLFDFAKGLVLCVEAKTNVPLWVGKIALFDKALVSALARGDLAMCAMWVGNCFKKCAVGKNKKHWVVFSVGFLALSMFRFSVLSQWFTFQFFYVVVCLLHLAVTFGNMASGGLRASSLSTVTKLDAGQKASNFYSPRHWLYCVLWACALFSR